jgi:hypothetical protein
MTLLDHEYIVHHAGIFTSAPANYRASCLDQQHKKTEQMILDGRIVEYLENGKFICAFVLTDNSNRLQLLNQNSRELNLATNRIVHCTHEKVAPLSSRE